MKAATDRSRDAALRRYAAAHDRLAEEEQRLMGRGLIHLAEDEHQRALIALRAWLAERDDPTPEVR